ncbi:MAG: flavin-containing monooxygenase [Gammaproteobacteria bacterium]
MAKSASSAHRIVIIGAGGGAICMAINLKRAGIHDFVMLEKSGGIGGTWWHNQYPGAECDVQSHLYSYSFEPKLDWSRPFAGQAEILEYLNHCVDKYDVRRHVRLHTQVTGLTWQEAAGRWQIEAAGGDTLAAQVVVSALGMFNELVWPDIPGIDDFRGTKFHSARWNHAHDLTGERVGVIGIAASAIQFVPEIAPKCGRLHLYQRTANWVVPKGNEPYSEEQLAYFRAHPEVVAKNRQDIYDVWNSLATFLDKDKMAEIERAGLERLQVVKDPETRRQLTPTHPFGCKRPLFSDVYYPVFNRDNVELITEGIARITPTGIETRDGGHRELDTIIFSTGFRTTQYIASMKVTGRNGLDVNAAWHDGAQAFKGVATAGFPNLFMLYGPNTNQGSILFMLEQQVGYVMRQIERMDRERLAWLDVRAEVMAKFNAQLQEDVRKIDVWQAACGNDFYYRSPTGRFVTNYPDTMDAFAAQMSTADPDAYEVAKAG